jgi:hypothetical protein
LYQARPGGAIRVGLVGAVAYLSSGRRGTRRPGEKNATPSSTQKPAIAFLEAIPSDTFQGIRDPAPMSVFLLTDRRVLAVTGACVGHLETDGV